MKRSLYAVAATGAFLGFGGLMASSCLTYTDITPDCPNFERGHVDANGQPDECHFNDPECSGTCLKRAGFPWIGPALVWIGPTDETPADCPDETYEPAIFAFADLVAPGNICPTCTCGPPSGSCEPPATITARAAMCSTPGGWTTAFNPPASWDGSCTSDNAIPAGKNCGGSPCVQSLTIAPLGVVEGDCTAFSGPPPLPVESVYWKTQAKACVGPIREDRCGDDELVCVPSADPPPPGFQHCIYRFGEHECPNAYPEKHVLYESFTGKRDCTPCECGPPLGSVCTGMLSIYEDGACTTPIEITTVTSSTAPCKDMAMVGTALGSKTLSKLSYQPGTCQASGGEPIGNVEPDSPATVCCAPQK